MVIALLWQCYKVPELEQLRPDHGPAVLAFELENRAYFAASISDRGDKFFDHFEENFTRLCAEQEAGTSAFYVLIGEHGAVLGRFNLYDIGGCGATVGYRVGQQIAGRGVATSTVRALCSAAARRGLSTLTAATSHENIASQRVLLKAGFLPDGPADPSELGGKQGGRFLRDLTGD